MRHGRAAGWGGLLGAVLAAAAGAAPPPAGEAIPDTFRVFVAADDRFPADSVRNRTGKLHCFVCEHGLAPVTAVFTRADPAKAADGPVGVLAKQLDGVVRKYRPNNAAAFVAFLSLSGEYPDDDREVGEGKARVAARIKEAEAVKALADQLKVPGVPFGLAAGKSPQTEAWGIQKGDDLVVVVYRRLKVVKRWSFPADQPPTEADLKAIGDAAEANAGGK